MYIICFKIKLNVKLIARIIYIYIYMLDYDVHLCTNKRTNYSSKNIIISF